MNNTKNVNKRTPLQERIAPVMLDPDVPVQSRIIYAYFCLRLKGAESAIIPANEVWEALGINKSTYYTHFRWLRKKGYIVVTVIMQEDGEKQVFGANRLFSLPPIQEAASRPGVNGSGKSIIGWDSQFANQDKLFAVVMMDSSLTLRAKAAYAYLFALCAGMTSDDNLGLSQKELANSMGVCPSHFRKVCDELEENGYLKSFQKRERDGGFGRIHYSLTTDLPEKSSQKASRAVKAGSAREVANAAPQK